ncbi:Oligoxyloglucan reducing end-specific cellobiohydrolase [Bimuria novae-zelandiae CBS 107.79]|uniref:Oligoxyloglucan reducing end-specific cellobiohydrolase n=1 Tax=Bimuria novae-zelandiae CBS 107.79 TaxID=1447943 RepID=A0A6A5UM82_9PLEO|nr:Oligoxyloglucan reducing end-specific cellobiohydrolase [Bimuria novae-zelandiae CBS 107.79]
MHFSLALILPLLSFSRSSPTNYGATEWHTKPITNANGLVTSGFRGLSVVSDRVIWVSGTNNSVYRTINGGVTWDDRPIVHSETFTNSTGTYPVVLDFRDIQAFNTRVAVAMAAGDGSLNETSVWYTSDGGKHWRKSRTPQNPIFYDSLAWENQHHGLLIQDAANASTDSLGILETHDGGRSWKHVATTGLEAKGQAAFAASGTCIAFAAGKWYIVAGGSPDPSRVFRSLNGRDWEAANTTLVGDPNVELGYSGYGYNSVAFKDSADGLVVGGSFSPDAPTSNDNAAYSRDGGRTWKPSKSTLLYRSGVSWLPGRGGLAVAVGQTGTNLTRNGGVTWEALTDEDQKEYFAVQCIKGSICWASGRRGAVGRIHIA